MQQQQHQPRHGTRSDGGACMELNVGGCIYTTTYGRLTCEDSQLKCLLTERSALDGEGRVFLDRDGELFKYVLGFLRDRTAVLPDDLFTLKKIRNEAIFYDLRSMVAYVDRKLSLISSETNPRIVELKEYHVDPPTGVPEILCTPLPSIFEPLYPTFESIPVTDIGRDSARLCTVKHAESAPQLASILHEQAGYRVVGYSNGAILMQRNDHLTA
eukprot:TRINITY_DN13425_c0_g1_i1.p1 TRINITY_DN13425_c0_g1~~TRINITY_DN13425_c0_g1_i1.p1  ORF type:complete len:214 (+),score=33.05 TRINITY_DN13425_c0_g1_i1:51-692(+)